MTDDEVKVAINALKDEIQKVELRMRKAGYRELASVLYNSRLHLSYALLDVVVWQSRRSTSPTGPGDGR